MTKLQFFSLTFCSGACTMNSFNRLGALLGAEPANTNPFSIFVTAVFAIGFGVYAWIKKDKLQP